MKQFNIFSFILLLPIRAGTIAMFFSLGFMQKKYYLLNLLGVSSL